MRALCSVVLCCLFLWTLTSTVALAFPKPKEDATLLQDKNYQSAQNEYIESLEAAKKELDKKTYAKLEKELAALITGNAQATISEGESVDAAWIMAYVDAAEYAKAEARFDFLRKNPIMFQGYYDANNGYDGYLLLEKQKNSDSYGVEFSLVQKGGAFNSGKLIGVSQPTGNKNVLKIFAENIGDGTVIGEISFQGEKITVKTTDTFKTSGYLGHGVVLDGEYVREKK